MKESDKIASKYSGEKFYFSRAGKNEIKHDDYGKSKQQLAENSLTNQQHLKIVNLQDAYDYIEKRTGRKIIDSSFENNTLTVRLSGNIKEINITATLSFADDNQTKSQQKQL